MEAVVFVGGVSLGQPAASIPIAAIVGMAVGLICGFLIYSFASRTSNFSCDFLYTHTDAELLHTALTIFLIVMTNFVLPHWCGASSASRLGIQANALDHLSVMPFIFTLPSVEF